MKLFNWDSRSRNIFGFACHNKKLYRVHTIRALLKTLERYFVRIGKGEDPIQNHVVRPREVAL